MHALENHDTASSLNALCNCSDLAYHVVDRCMYSNCQCTKYVPCMETEALIIFISFSSARLC